VRVPRALAVTLLLASAFLAAPATSAGPASTTATTATAYAVTERPAVVERRVIGESVRGRPIVAWRVGRPAATRKFVILSTMHGDEPDTRHILTALRDGRPIRGADIWLVPVLNPDGLARRTRKNAHGVDLNRNFPYSWRDLDGRYESGPRAGSEPETRALVRFLREVRPLRIVSFHQPLHSVDTDTKAPRFARRLAEELGLPRATLDCGGVCHGTMTGWYNRNFAGAGVTVEYGAHPTYRRMTVAAPAQLLRVIGAERWSGG